MNRPASLTEDQTEALRIAADTASVSIVHVRTVVHKPAARYRQDASARPASLPSGGTGVVIASDGLILTNEHVVRNATEIRVVLPDGSQHAVTQIVRDTRLDLAVLQIEATGLHALSVVQAPADPGDSVVAIGWSDPGRRTCARPGVVTDASASLQHELDPSRRRCYAGLIESTARLDPGFSGGPLLDDRGRLVGLNVAIAGAGKNRRAYAVPFSSEVCQAITAIASQALGQHAFPIAGGETLETDGLLGAAHLRDDLVH